MAFLHQFLEGLRRAPACLVTIESTQGSAPREVGAWMAVFEDQVLGTIGGGHVEFDAMAHARSRLPGPQPLASETLRYALGPSLGQCCGGVMHLRFENLSVHDAELASLQKRLSPTLQPLALFGGGHVGLSLIHI